MVFKHVESYVDGCLHIIAVTDAALDGILTVVCAYDAVTVVIVLDVPMVRLVGVLGCVVNATRPVDVEVTISMDLVGRVHRVVISLILLIDMEVVVASTVQRGVIPVQVGDTVITVVLVNTPAADGVDVVDAHLTPMLVVDGVGV
jgi:hypothetical protein